MGNERRTGWRGDKEPHHEKNRVFVLVVHTLSVWRGGAKPQQRTPSVSYQRHMSAISFSGDYFRVTSRLMKTVECFQVKRKVAMV